MPVGTYRIGGSGYTFLAIPSGNSYSTLNVAILSFQDTGEQLNGSPEAVIPIHMNRPAEIVVPECSKGGTVTLKIAERWDRPAWREFVNTGAIDLPTIIRASRNLAIVQIIRDGNGYKRRGYRYNGVVITNPGMEESVDSTTGIVQKTIEFQYTHRSAF